MQIEKLLINNLVEVYPENFAFQLFIILQLFTLETCNFLKKVTFLILSIVFSVCKQNLSLRTNKRDDFETENFYHVISITIP